MSQDDTLSPEPVQPEPALPDLIDYAPPPSVLVAPDLTEVYRGLEDLQYDQAVVAQVLQVIEEAGTAINRGRLPGFTADLFGGSRQGERMARHTARAQGRVDEGLNLALMALAQHHVALNTFVSEMRGVEDQTTAELASLQSRLGEAPA